MLPAVSNTENAMIRSLLAARMVAGILFLAGTACFVGVATALGDEDPWSASPEHVRRWYRNLMQPDNPSILCCGEADAYHADSFEVDEDRYVAIITDERDMPNREPRAVGTRIVVPNHKLKYDAGNPTGHGVIFLRPGSDDVWCYVAPGGV